MSEDNNQPKDEKTGADPSAEARTAAAEKAAADRSSRRRAASNKIVEYADADDDMRAMMEKIMDPIDRAPDDFEFIITYGTPPLKELGTVADRMMAVQRDFDSQVNVMDDAMSRIEKTVTGFEFGKLADAVKGLAADAVNGGAKAVGKGFGLGKAVVGGIFGGGKKEKAKLDANQQLIDDMQSKLPDLMKEMFDLVDEIQDTENGIKQVMAEAEKLGKARLDATRQLNIYIGAGKEVLRRYNEEYIPQAQEIFEESADPEDQMYLERVIKSKDHFIDRLTILEGSRTQSVVAARQLMQMLETMEDQRKKVQDIIYNSQNEWKAIMASAGIAGSSLKVAKTLQRADALGDKVHDQTMDMIEKAHQMTLNSKSRGTVDPEKLIQATQRLTKMIEQSENQRVNRNKTLEETAKKLRGATDLLIEAANSTDQKRLLEAVKEAETDAAKGKPPSNDDTKPTPRPSRRANGNGPGNL